MMTNPMPFVPPVTRAVIPLRDHLWFIVKYSGAAIFVSAGARSHLCSAKGQAN